MAMIKKDHYFYEGRKGNNNDGPGILVVEGKYKFRLNKANRDRTVFTMYCVMQSHPEFACKAKAIVGKRYDEVSFNILVLMIIITLTTLKSLMLHRDMRFSK